MFSRLIAAIDRFEAALRRGAGPALDDAERHLLAALEDLGPADYEGGSEHAEGCTFGVSHEGTVYAPGHGPDGRPRVVLMRAIRNAEGLPCAVLTRKFYPTIAETA